MDSDAKELGHVRVDDRKTVWAYQGWNVIIHSCVGNACSFAFRNRPHESAIEQTAVENNESLVSGLSKNAGLRHPLWVIT